MGSLSIWHWFITISIWWIILGWPIAKILGRMGYSKWLVIIVFIPFVNIAGIWIIATSQWPRDKAAQAKVFE